MLPSSACSHGVNSKSWCCLRLVCPHPAHQHAQQLRYLSKVILLPFFSLTLLGSGYKPCGGKQVLESYSHSSLMCTQCAVPAVYLLHDVRFAGGESLQLPEIPLSEGQDGFITLSQCWLWCSGSILPFWQEPIICSGPTPPSFTQQPWGLTDGTKWWFSSTKSPRIAYCER